MVRQLGAPRALFGGGGMAYSAARPSHMGLVSLMCSWSGRRVHPDVVREKTWPPSSGRGRSCDAASTSWRCPRSPHSAACSRRRWGRGGAPPGSHTCACCLGTARGGGPPTTSRSSIVRTHPARYLSLQTAPVVIFSFEKEDDCIHIYPRRAEINKRTTLCRSVSQSRVTTARRSHSLFRSAWAPARRKGRQRST